MNLFYRIMIVFTLILSFFTPDSWCYADLIGLWNMTHPIVVGLIVIYSAVIVVLSYSWSNKDKA